jgi:2-amino-4-hydroxy-6-hydroxymethyldihydropteridine diphosphokinase
MTWADELGEDDETRRAWRDAALWHDALRDAEPATLRVLVPDADYPDELLHGPAAAAMLERDGEQRIEVLEAIRWHTVGCANWGRTGRALYMADFLEPGRKFARADRAFLADRVPADFDAVLRQVTRQRLEWALREGHELYAETVALWNAVR